MKLTIDTKEDSHDDIRKVIKMLQHIVGDSNEVFSNQPDILPSQASESSPIANIFGNVPSSTAMQSSSESAQAQASSSETTTASTQSDETSQSTEDLFAELFSEEELKKMDLPKEEDEKEDLEAKSKDKKYSIEFY